MDYDALRNVLKNPKEIKLANRREELYLREVIHGTGGINFQRKLTKRDSIHQAREVRRDLAKVLYGRKRINPSQFKQCKEMFPLAPISNETPMEIYQSKRKQYSQRHTVRLLVREKTNARNAQTRVDEFLKNFNKESASPPNIIEHPPTPVFIRSPALPAIITSDCEHEDLYAPDGQLRSKFTLPAIEGSWEEAKNTRYVRTRLLREFERELNLKEVFGRMPSLYSSQY